jgi:tyrosyl-tRNA synthetase|tara:strand:+ start:8343 stop:9314 length:972 start_codon:yes stop_codon:yes gene_type:complete
MDNKEKLDLIRRNAEEIISEQELKSLLKKKKNLVTYCGYEVSGEIHLGHLVTMTKLLDLQKAGVKVIILFADWHTWLNKKGDWDFIHNQIKVWEKAFRAAGLSKAKFVLGSSFQRDIKYIDDVLRMSLKTTINRALRSMQVVARDIDHARVSQVVYPFMQLVDIKHLKVDLVTAGMDQRKIHMLGVDGMFKEVDYKTPIFIHTSIIPSLKGSGGKMASSDPTSLISITDSSKIIKEKINKAYCVLGEVKDNPILSILKLIIFPRISSFVIKRDERYGGDLTFENYECLEEKFKSKEIHPQDLKNSVSDYLIEVLVPIKKYFKK